MTDNRNWQRILFSRERIERKLRRLQSSQRMEFAEFSDALSEAHRLIGRVTSSLIASAEEESRRWARELHDVHAQDLALAALEVAMLKPENVDQETLDRLGGRLEKLSRAIRDLSRRMHPDILVNLGLVAALEAEVEAVRERDATVRVKWRHRNVPPELGEDVSLCLYRIAQESLRNAGKHAQAANIEVRLESSGAGVTLRVQDDGQGFEVDSPRRGLGLISMRERARSVGGRLEVRSSPGQGATIQVHLPLPGISDSK